MCLNSVGGVGFGDGGEERDTLTSSNILHPIHQFPSLYTRHQCHFFSTHSVPDLQLSCPGNSLKVPGHRSIIPAWPATITSSETGNSIRTTPEQLDY